MAQDQGGAEAGDRRPRQADQSGEDHHRAADGPDHLRDHADRQVGGEVPAEGDDGELEEDEPQAPAQQEPAQLARRAPGTGHPGAGAGEEHEHGGAEVGDPPGAEQRQVGAVQVGRVEVRIGEVGAHVVEHHDDHDQAAEQVHVVEPAAGRRRGGDSLDLTDAVGAGRSVGLEDRGHEGSLGKGTSRVAPNREPGGHIARQVS